MICFRFSGLHISLDFTAPVLAALLSMYLPPAALCRTLAACLLHECAHLLMIAMIGKKPVYLRISAAGMRLEAAGTALLPLHLFTAILLAGPAANLLAAFGFRIFGMTEAAAANLSLCLFNLLPFRSTDGGTLLCEWLEHRLLPHRPELPRRILRCTAIGAALVILTMVYCSDVRSISLCGMILFMLAAEFTD